MSVNFQSTTLATLMLTNLAGSSTSNEVNSTLDYYQQQPSSVIMENNNLASSNLNSTNWTTNISEEDELKLLNFPGKREDLSTAIPLTVIFGLLFLTGCIGNLCTAIVIARPKNKYMHTATNYYLFSLAMSDFLFLILGLPQEMYTLWQRYPYAFGDSFCIIRGYLSEASTYASILTISAFTIERYVAICHPLWAHTMSQLPRAITSILIIWLLAAICAIPPAAELGIDYQRGPITNRTLPETAQCVTKRTIYENMFVVSAIVFFIVPMIIVTILYILIALELRRSSKMNNAISSQSTQHHHQLIHPVVSNHRFHNHHRHHLCAARGSRSQQFLNDTTSTPPGSPFNNNRNLKVNTDGTKVDEQGSLMDNIMSQRPSSAIGTEHLASSFGPFKLLPFSCSYKWPFAAWSGQQSEKCDFHHHHHHQPVCCHQNQIENQNQNQNQQLNVSNKKPSIQLTTTQSNQYEPVEQQTSCVLISQSPETTTATTRNHSPLSYHESLIEHQTNPNKLPSHINNQRHPQHQLSLQVNSSRNLSNQGIVTTKPQHPHRHHHHHHQQQQHHCNHNHHHNQQNQHSHHQTNSSYRRSAAASSKKSVVRMLDTRSEESIDRMIMNSRHIHLSDLASKCGKVEENGASSSSSSVMDSTSLTSCNIKEISSSSLTSSSTFTITNNNNIITTIPNQKYETHKYFIVAVVVSFFICWVPFHAQRLLASYLAREREENDTDKNQFLHDVYLKLTYISGIMYYLSSTINPLLYQLMSAKFRLAFKETFKCSLFKCAIFSSSSSRRASGCSPSNSLKCQQMDLTNSRQQTTNCRRCSCSSCSCHCCYSSSFHDSKTSKRMPSNHTKTDCNAICMANSDYSTAEHLLLPSQQQQQQEEHDGRLREQLEKKRKIARFLAQLANFIHRAGRFVGLKQTARSAQDCELNCAQCADQSCCERLTRNSLPEDKSSAAPCPAIPLLAGTPTTLKFTRSLCRMSSHEEEESPVSGRQQLEQLVQPAAVKKKLPLDDEDNRTLSSPESGKLSGSSSDQPTDQQQNEGFVCGSKEVLRESGASPDRNLLHQQSVNLLGLDDGQLSEEQCRKSSSTSKNKHLLTHSSSLSSSDRQLEKKLSLSTTTSAIDDCSTSFTNSQLTAAGSNQALKDDDRSLASASASASSRSSTGIGGNERNTVINIKDDSHLVLIGQE